MTLTPEQEEKIRRKLTIDEFNEMFLKSKDAKRWEYEHTLLIGFEHEPTLPVKLLAEYTPDDKVRYMDMLNTIKYLQIMRQSLTSDEEWYPILQDQVTQGRITQEHADVIKSSARKKLTKAEWNEKVGHIFPLKGVGKHAEV